MILAKKLGEGYDPIAQSRKLRLRELRGLPKAHTAREGWDRIGTQVRGTQAVSQALESTQ